MHRHDTFTYGGSDSRTRSRTVNVQFPNGVDANSVWAVARPASRMSHCGTGRAIACDTNDIRRRGIRAAHHRMNRRATLNHTRTTDMARP